jgi:hypothetical protein
MQPVPTDGDPAETMDVMLHTIRRLQTENEYWLREHDRVQRENSYLRSKVEALERHHATFTAGVAESTEQYSATLDSTRQRLRELERERVEAAQALHAAATHGRPAPLGVALSAAIRAHPELFAVQQYRADAMRGSET